MKVLAEILVISILLILIGTSPKLISIEKVTQFDPVNSCVLVYNDTGHGSGSIVGKNCVLTAAHVAILEGLKIKTNDEQIYSVVRYALDPDSDIAFIYIDGEFDEQPLGIDKTPMKVGDSVTLIGTPMTVDLMNSVLTGKVVKIDVDATGTIWKNLDIFDTHSAPGTSGGPILDSQNRVRGIVVTGMGLVTGAVPMDELNIE